MIDNDNGINYLDYTAGVQVQEFEVSIKIMMKTIIINQGIIIMSYMYACTVLQVFSSSIVLLLIPFSLPPSLKV